MSTTSERKGEGRLFYLIAYVLLHMLHSGLNCWVEGAQHHGFSAFRTGRGTEGADRHVLPRGLVATWALKCAAGELHCGTAQLIL